MKPRKSCRVADVQGTPLRREHAGARISVVKFLPDREEHANFFVSGSARSGFDSSGSNTECTMALWKISGSRQVADGDENSGMERIAETRVSSDCNDIFVVSTTELVVGLANGDVNLIKCGLSGTGSNRPSITVAQNFPSVHGKAASSTGVCAIRNEIFSGSDTGSLVWVNPGHHSAATGSRQHVNTLATDLMAIRCMTPVGSSQITSGHSSGQLHLWDIRQVGSGASPLVISRAVAPLNDAVTALAVHPAQTNVLAFGTNSGSVSFVDVRQPKELCSSGLFKIAQEPIRHIKFHPTYPDHCFSCTESAVIRWDATSLSSGDETTNPRIMDTAGTIDENQPMDEGDTNGGQQHSNAWVSERAWNNIQLKALVEEDPRLISSFDVSLDALIIGCHTGTLAIANSLDLF